MTVEFEGDKYVTNRQNFQGGSFGANKGSSKFAQWLIDKGIVKTDVAAQSILIAIIMVAFAATGIILYGMRGEEVPPRTQAELEELKRSYQQMQSQENL